MSYIVAAPVPFSFGSFDYFCNQIALPFCPLINGGKEPACYARNIDIGLLIFEPATLVIHIIALIMTAIMISHIKFKFTAVGRKEIVLFFYLYAVTIVAEFLVISGIIPFSSSLYPYFVATHSSLAISTLWCLFVNGFVPFQFIEDGTPKSLWLLRISTLVIFVASYFINIATMKSIFGFSSSNPAIMWTLYFVFGAAFVFIYFVLQIILVFSSLNERSPIFDIMLAASFAICAQVVAFVFSNTICNVVKHYLDGMFFSTIFNLLAVMMVYKYWDSITKEDLEFAVGCKNNTWEIRDPLLSDSAMASMSESNYGARR
ncbi:chitin synthase III catalytic subunit [Globomyces pollinis-pini]|nr:chitin synthase III catalytic subunit [Globomyces pollinis-pini]